MPPSLPDDVWIHIIELRPMEYFPNVRRFPRNLALTCKRLHPIATPFVYRELGFAVDFEDNEDRSFEIAMTGLIKDLIRAKSLLHSPHLLRHVEQLTLWQWDDHISRTVISAYYFSPEEDWDDLAAINTWDGGNMISTIYDLITRLIPHMPVLQKLWMAQSPITPLLYAAICSLPRLTSFEFAVHFDSHVIHEQSGPIDPPPTLHIRNLRYDNTRANGYLSNVLAGSAMSLHTLSITSPNLSLIPSYICKRALPLKTLQVEFLEENTADHDAHFALWDTLRATPDLRTLLIHGYGLDVPPPDDLCNHLYNLFQLCASRMTVQKLAEGKELDAIQVNKTFYISEQSITQIVTCSPTRLRVLTLNAVEPKTQQELDNFISSFHVFRCLEYLDIDHHFPDSPATDADFHESLKVIKNLWRELKHLHSFNLHGYNPLEYPNEYPYGIAAACPLDVNDELLPRGHPTLERIGVSFMRRSLWEWDPQHGWAFRQWSYEAWHDGSYMSWNRV